MLSWITIPCLAGVALYPVVFSPNLFNHPVVRWGLLLSTVQSLVGYYLTTSIIPYVAPRILNKLNGVDIGKKGLGMPGMERGGDVDNYVCSLCMCPFLYHLVKHIYKILS